MKILCAFILAILLFNTDWTIASEGGDGHGDVEGPDAIHFDASQGVDMLKVIGAPAMVEGTVIEVAEGKSGKATFINFFPYNPDNKDFHIVVFDKTIQGDPAAWSSLLKELTGKKVRVTGSIKEYKGKPQIELELIDQIEVVTEGASDMPSQ